MHENASAYLYYVFIQVKKAVLNCFICTSEVVDEINDHIIVDSSFIPRVVYTVVYFCLPAPCGLRYNNSIDYYFYLNKTKIIY